MKDNKGQTLIFFIIFLPIILFILIFIIELSNMNYEKNKLDNLTYTLILYKLDNKDIYKLLNENDKNIKCTISNDEIELKKKYKFIFFKILSDDEYIKSKYKGYIKNNKKVIKKVI